MDNNEHFTKKDANFRFADYFDKVKEITEMVPREVNYQLELIKPFLESVLIKQIQVVDTSNNGRDTKTHTREAYATTHGAAPDLILANGYKYANKQSKSPIVYAAVEIKTPSSDENIYGEIKDYNNRVVEEMATYLCKCKNVILTNCNRWQFFCLREDCDKSMLFYFADLLPILNLKNRDWYNPKVKKIKPSYKDRLKELNKKDQYEKLNSFFENKEDKLLKRVRNFTALKNEDEMEKLINRLRAYLDNYIKDVIKAVETIDLFPQEKFMDKNEYEEEPKEWGELVNYLQNSYNN
ncbi:MAG: hypothetical protein E6845_17270 [Clostridium sp.]|uniref:hypothetical protein n=1 Tax=Clostridium sp. TaxID=1506 RepID=UPI0028FF5FFC|nr:hypothetical protein [Clostridium sp.]MDU1604710.1 hypothetical protein [Clostridium sp.]